MVGPNPGWGTSDAQTGEACQSCDLSSAEPRYHELHHGFYFHRLSSSDDIITPPVVASGSPPLAFSEVEVVSKGDGVRGQR